MFTVAFLRRPLGGFFMRFVLLDVLMIATAMMLLTRTAFAQTATPALPPIQIGFWVQLLLGVAAISIPTALTIFGTWLKAHFNMAAGSNAANITDLLVTAGQQFAAAAIAKAPATANTITVKNAAIDEFLSTLSDTTQAAMKLKGTTAATIAQRIDGALTLALAPPAKPAAPAAAK